MAMLSHAVRGALGLLLYLANTLLWAIPLFALALVKLLVPVARGRALIGKVLDEIATQWVAVNTAIQRLTTGVRLQVEGLRELPLREWYLVVANHQSWVDILVLQRLFHRRIPFLKFFLKKELIWVPVLGLAWWALDFPFMRRYSRAFVEKYPHLKGRDVETTRRACAKFRHLPVTIINFVEGTRFTRAKHDAQHSPFRHLLQPRAGGIAHVLASMGGQLHQLLDVTIHYPGGAPSFWDFAAGKVREIRVHVRCLPLSDQVIGDYQNDPSYQRQFQSWLNQLWHDKDARLDALKG